MTILCALLPNVHHHPTCITTLHASLPCVHDHPGSSPRPPSLPRTSWPPTGSVGCLHTPLHNPPPARHIPRPHSSSSTSSSTSPPVHIALAHITPHPPSSKHPIPTSWPLPLIILPPSSHPSTFPPIQIMESSQTLLHVLKRESVNLTKKKQASS